jgi:RHS repeat-associated protein
MMLAAKHFDPIIGIDIHIIQPPGPVPPVPIPHPFIGMVIDPFDYVPIVGSTVLVNGIHRAQAGTAGKCIPPHIPIGGTFIKPPGNEGEIFMGSSTVSVDGDAFSYLALPALTCQDVGMPPPPRPKKKSKTKSLVLPTSIVLPIPAGPPILVGGAPTISLMALGMKAGMAGLGKGLKRLSKTKGFKKIKSKLDKIKKKGKKQKKGNKPPSNEGSCKGGCPVDAITGAVIDEFTDFEFKGPPHFIWRRYYDSSWAQHKSPMGNGWRHGYMWTLKETEDGFAMACGYGSIIEFDPIDPATGQSVWSGFQLSQISQSIYQVHRQDHPTMEFILKDKGTSGHLERLITGKHSARFTYHSDGRLDAILFSSGQRVIIISNSSGNISEVNISDSENGFRSIARYDYDRAGNQTVYIDALGNRTTYKYDDANRKTCKTDPLGYSINYAYDDTGRCVRTWGHDGLYDERFEYSPEINQALRKSSSGAIWTYIYDTNQTAIQIIDPYDGCRSFQTDDDGRVVFDLDQNGLSTELLYNKFGEHVGRLTPLGVINPPSHIDNDPPDPLPLRVPRTPLEWNWGGIIKPDHIPPETRKQVTASLDPGERNLLGRKPEKVYDAMGRLIESTDSQGRTERWTYDANGNELSYTDADGSEYRKEYFSWNLLRSCITPGGAITQFDYNAHEEIARVIDPGGTVSEFSYDLKDQLTEITRHGKIRETYAYDAAGNLIEKRDSKNQTLLTFEIGSNGLPVKRSLASGQIDEFEYDHLGYFTRAATATSETVFNFDAAGRALADVREGKGVSHTIAYNHVSETVVFDQYHTEFDFDFSGNAQITDPTGAHHQLKIDDSNGTITRTSANGSAVVQKYNNDGLLVEQTITSPDAISENTRWEYSNRGDLLAQTGPQGNIQYRYDSDHRLIKETRNDGTTHTYEYDQANNIIHKTGLGRIRLDSGNRLSSVGSTKFTYNNRDHIASRSSSSGETCYHYDSKDILIAADINGKKWVAEYDPLCRRIRKTWKGKTTEYFWDDKRLSAEISAEGSIRIYIYIDIDALVPFMFIDYDSIQDDPKDGRSYFVYTDQRGCPFCITNTANDTVWRADIDPYGFAVIDPKSTIEFNLRMPGHYFDAETGLHYNRFRYYDPRIGRYLQSDPIGLAGGTNLYAYSNNPLTHVDIVGWEHASDVGGVKGKNNNAGGVYAETTKAKLGDAEAAEALAAKGGMDPGHLKNLQKHCAENDRMVIMRAGNQASVPHIQNPNGVPKPLACKLNTATSGDNAGKVTTGQSPEKWKPKSEGGKGYQKNLDDLKAEKKPWKVEDGVIKDPNGKFVHGDYDMQGVYDKKPDGTYGPPKKKDGTPYEDGTDDPQFQKEINEALNDPENYNGLEKDMVQHGANDDFKPDGKTPGRYPEPKENYIVVDENGNAELIEGTDRLEEFYGKNEGLDWPYK